MGQIGDGGYERERKIQRERRREEYERMRDI